jgi:hypothetical protein
MLILAATVAFGRIWSRLTLPLSGSQGDGGGEAGSRWRHVHSKGMLFVPLRRDTFLERFQGKRIETHSLGLSSHR